jgi:HEAT repeat protein
MRRRLEMGTVVLLLIGAVLVSRSLIVRYMHPKIDNKLYEVLNGKKSTEPQRLDALMALAKIKDPVALKAARNWVNADSNFFQRGGVTALSFYDDKDVLPDIQKVFATLQEDVRLKTLEAFATNNPTAARKAWFYELSKSSDYSIGVSGRIYSLRGETDENKIANNLKAVFADFEHLGEASQMRILEEVNTHFATSPTAQEWMLSLVDGSRPSHMQAVAIQELSAVKASGLDSHLGHLAHNSEPEIRAAAIEAIPVVCPKGLWNILDEAARTEPNSFVLQRILTDLSYLKGKDADKTLKAVKARDGKLPKEVTSILPTIERDLASAPQTNRCAK